MPDPTKPVTLADLDRQGKLAWVYCNECGRERDVPPRDLGLPLDTPAPEAGKRLVCSACGDRKVTVRPELYPGGVEEVLSRYRTVVAQIYRKFMFTLLPSRPSTCSMLRCGVGGENSLC